MSRGGIEAYMMNYYRKINKEKLQIDFIVHGFDKGIYDEEIKKLGGKIFNIPVKSSNYFANVNALRKIFKENSYKIIHSHMDAMSYLVLKEAKRSGIPIRIAHSHNTNHLTKNKIKFLINEYARKHLNNHLTHRFACSEAAGRWLFGDETVEAKKIFIARNAVDVDKFQFNASIREKLRNDLGINNKFVVGHIGRFDYQKNHQFVIGIFNEVFKKNKDSFLILIGDGVLKEEIKSKVNALGLEKNVMFVGGVDNVQDFLNIFDVLILPSHFEGLPVTLIEAQINSVMSFAADVVTAETKFTDRLEFVSLNEPASKWANIILRYEKGYKRVKTKNSPGVDDYDINAQVKILEEFYVKELALLKK